ncbi:MULTISPECIES: hypothetical protein [Erwinia]|uniref:hypothetical protein n=1 Tax=Erwinia TaxID=551 RepID=UPI00105D2CB4|nr:hypothetical protein [Erwinia aphidicola]MCP2233709.1 hypothetical protein [Erwinia aphidicola]
MKKLTQLIGEVMMSASDLLKLKFHSDRQLALYSEAGLKNVIRSAQGVVSNVYSGVERASWYTSCLTERYADVCQELKTEDYRMYLSIKSLYRYRDAIQLMIMMYISMVVDDATGKNEKGTVRNLVRVFTEAQGNRFVGKTTRLALIYPLAKSMAESKILTESVTEIVSKNMPYLVQVAQVYGIEQKAAMAARKLKAIEPNYYWALYELQLEMLYIFVDPILNFAVQQIRNKLHEGVSVEEAVKIMGDIFDV